MQGTGIRFNNKHQKVVATIGKHGKPVGWTKTILDTIEPESVYTFFNDDGTE